MLEHEGFSDFWKRTSDFMIFVLGVSKTVRKVSKTVIFLAKMNGFLAVNDCQFEVTRPT